MWEFNKLIYSARGNPGTQEALELYYFHYYYGFCCGFTWTTPTGPALSGEKNGYKLWAKIKLQTKQTSNTETPIIWRLQRVESNQADSGEESGLASGIGELPLF